MAYTQILKATFDEKLEKGTLDILRNVAKLAHHPKGSVLCKQGAIEETFYIIVEGLVSSTQKSEDGGSRLLDMLGPNQYFGEMGLLDNMPRLSTCKAISDVKVLEVTKEVFNDLVEVSPAVAYAVTRHIMTSMRHLDELFISDLQEKNEALQKAYDDLQTAQEKLVENERMEREVELAADVQRSLLPDIFPTYPDYSIVAHIQPARMVGGDFYDVIELDDEHIGLLIADVADKGIHAAMLMAVTRTLFFTESRRSLSPAEVASTVHKYLMEVAPATDVFVTALYGVLHRPSGKLTYVRAGHELPFLFRPGQPVEPLQSTGRFLGMVRELELGEYTFKLQSGDKLVLYSDGVTDATNNAGERFGNERFRTAIEKKGGLSASGLVPSIVSELADWTQGSAPFDDLAILVVEAK